MNRDQLAHVLRASCQIADGPHIPVIGSQSILGTFDEGMRPRRRPPPERPTSPSWTTPAGMKADLADGAIGELSPSCRLLDAGLLDAGELIHRSTDLPVQTVALTCITGFLHALIKDGGSR